MTITTLILDIDGTFTDGGVYYDEHGNEIKKFCTKDGTGVVCARIAGIHTVVLTGRECVATTRRMEELGIDEIHQNVKDKVAFLKQWFAENKVEQKNTAYIGDDINDIGPMKLCGYVACPADAAAEVKTIADYISPVLGGHGAVRDVVEWILKEEKLWEETVNNAFGVGI